MPAYSGLVIRHLDIPLAPLVLTLVLGPLMERSLRESLEMSQGDFSIFLNRPICGRAASHWGY